MKLLNIAAKKCDNGLSDINRSCSVAHSTRAFILGLKSEDWAKTILLLDSIDMDSRRMSA